MESVSPAAHDDFAVPTVTFNPSALELTLTGPAYSLRWTAPEVLDDGIQDLASDMWATGWICWEVSADQPVTLTAQLQVHVRRSLADYYR